MIIEICGVQIACRGEEAIGEVRGKDDVALPICEKCLEVLTPPGQAYSIEK